MATIKCTKCGTIIENVTSGVVVCSNCGHKMRYVPKNSKANAQSDGDTNKTQQNKKVSSVISSKEKTQHPKKKKGCLFYFLVGMVILLFIIIVGLTQSSEDEEIKQDVSHREDMYGISEKDIDSIEGEIIVQKVINDVTGKWRLLTIADDIDIEEYALSYYDKYFESNDEIHAIINFYRNTSTKISVIGDMLDVVIHEYVDKEELDASTLFSGMVYQEFYIYLDNGDIEKLGMDNTVEENTYVDATSENFINDIKNLDVISEDESIIDIRLENRDLCLYVDLNKSNMNVSLPPENKAVILTISITDKILTLTGYDDLWDTITVDFGDVGKITNSKANMETTGTGRYFVGNPVLE